ncbi:hypothetical protein U9M48_030560 [Paspalum notatum var. saurae]|uniref:Uncharacterized protein n=1 Tax=Paspalum notatum var. saurae TaxID=547442 RepID=A0AAQ3X3V6_PASNO
MDPSSVQLILDEMKKTQQSQDARFNDLETSFTGYDDRLASIESATTSLTEANNITQWCSSVDSNVDILKLETGSIRKHLERVVQEIHTSSAGILPNPPVTATTTAATPDAAKLHHSSPNRDHEMGQEEVTTPHRVTEVKQSAFLLTQHCQLKGPHPLPLPPRTDKFTPLNDKKQSLPNSQPVQDKLAALKAYRKAQGLCFSCGDKWAPRHKCSSTVQRQMIQGIWELFHLSAEEEDTPSSPTSSAQLFITLSQEAVTGHSTPTTLKFQGDLSGHNILILVDSGSTHTFVSASLASQLTEATPLLSPIMVQVANGNTIMCNFELLNTSWTMQGYSFTLPMKILPFRYQGKLVQLQGQLPNDYELHTIELSVLVDIPSTRDIPPFIQSVLDQHTTVFEVPHGLPPSRSVDHCIPLIDGAQPFVIRPYRYSPALKTEIEKQVTQC